MSARLLYGSGGMGKTRLLMELCKQLNEEKIWRAGFVPKDLLPEQLAALATADRPTLAVIDYAESRPGLKALLEAVRSRKPESQSKLRLVLLSRNVGDWLTALHESSAFVNDLLRDHLPVELAPLATTSEGRKEAFQNAVEGFARILKKEIPKTLAPSLDDPQYARVLYVHMAALAAVERRSVNAATLLEDTLDHEQRLWLTRFPGGDSFDVQLLNERICRAITALTLVGGAADRSAARKIIARATDAPDDKLTLFLHGLYPGGQRTAGDMMYVSGLEPDLLGEAMALRTLKKEGTEAGVYLDRVFDSADQRAARTGFEVLGRLSGEHPEAGEWIARMLDRDVAGRSLSAFHAALAIVEDDSVGARCPFAPRDSSRSTATRLSTFSTVSPPSTPSARPDQPSPARRRALDQLPLPRQCKPAPLPRPRAPIKARPRAARPATNPPRSASPTGIAPSFTLCAPRSRKNPPSSPQKRPQPRRIARLPALSPARSRRIPVRVTLKRPRSRGIDPSSAPPTPRSRRITLRRAVLRPPSRRIDRDRTITLPRSRFSPSLPRAALLASLSAIDTRFLAPVISSTRGGHNPLLLHLSLFLTERRSLA
ncbi:MAG: hypothetical protein ACMG6S_13145 [Byssovorax sp.]